MNFRWAPAFIAVALLIVAAAWAFNSRAVANAFAVVACATSAPCDGGNNTGAGQGVSGTAANAAGVSGNSKTTYGVLGSSNGIAGVIGTSTDKTGVMAKSTNGIGLYASTAKGFTAVYGVSSQASAASQLSQAAVSGSGVGGVGVYGVSTNRNGVVAENNTNGFYALYAQADSGFGYPFEATNTAKGSYFYVDDAGNGYFSGSVNHALRPRGARPVSAFGAQSTRLQLEDTGTARLSGGRAVVQFDATFARTIDFGKGYQVFLTPGGDTRGLYVAYKSPNGFEVRETQDGRSTIPFDYRIVAQPVGSRGERLPEMRNVPLGPNAPGHVPSTR